MQPPPRKMKITSMNRLARQPVPEEDRIYFSKLVEIIDDNYPPIWRMWNVQKTSYKDLFGEKISPEVESELRYAIPTGELANVFFPEYPIIPEMKFRFIQRKLLSWPLARALIYSPHYIVEKNHTYAYDQFMETINMLKPRLTWNDVAPSSILSNKRSASPDLPEAKTPRRLIDAELQHSMLENIVQLITSQSEAIENIAVKVTALVDKGDASQSALCQSVVDSTRSNEGSEVPIQGKIPDTEAPVDPNHKELQKEKLGSQSPKTQQKLVKLECDLTPSTIKAERIIAEADPQLAQLGRKCQRLGDGYWTKINYADVEKIFHATPVFDALKVNTILAPSTPASTSLSHLEKSDTTLAAIAHGLLLQRKALQEACRQLDVKTQQEVRKHFLNADSSFIKISEGLLQYTCGKRAEVIQQRRESYTSPNKVLNEILHKIPPSDTHLFSEEKLSNAVKDLKAQSFFIQPE